MKPLYLIKTAKIASHIKHQIWLDIILLSSDTHSHLFNYDTASHMYICVCNAVTEREIRHCARLGCSLDDLRERLGVCTNCGKCEHATKQILREERSAHGQSSQLQPA
jgi:bacterioferritin-associated ferredoxin